MDKKVYSSWAEVFEAFSDSEKAKIKAYVADVCGVAAVAVDDDKVLNDVCTYFGVYADGSTNVYGNDVPDVIDGVPACTKENFLWALS